jgi:hypothetical protein
MGWVCSKDEGAAIIISDVQHSDSTSYISLV